MQTLGLLALTHSSRRTNLARCSADFLARRFADPGRLERLPPFATLPPPAALFSGAVSLYRVVDDGGHVYLHSLGRVKHRDKIQHAVFLREADLLVGFEHRLERWRLPGPTLVRCYEHPHLVDLHTVAPLPEGRALLACSAPDAVLILDLASGAVEKTLRLPAALYGRGYGLTPEMDLRRHHIDDDAQTTHVNAAHPFDGDRRAVLSTLIQGAIGVFDLASGDYRELARGFIGCHGARVNTEGEIYFADSTSGQLVFLDDRGRVSRRFDAGSRWLHDVQQIGGSVYAFALADANELALWDVASRRLVFRRRFLAWPLEGLFGLARALPGWLGNSTQALSLTPSEIGD
jgi:hypothetical protein